MKILIADSGSTKTDWALVDEQGNVMVTCKTQGISPIHQSDAEILDVLCKELVLSEQPQEVFFYGSGVTEAMKSRMKSLLQQSFPEAKVEAEGDMLGAARVWQETGYRLYFGNRCQQLSLRWREDCDEHASVGIYPGR